MLSMKSLLSKPDAAKISVGDKPEFDISGNAHKRIDHTTPPGISPKPVFTSRDPEPEETEDDIAFRRNRAAARQQGQPLEESNTVHVSKADRANEDFMAGLKQAAIDKGQDAKCDLADKTPDWVRGYNTVKRSTWWDKANDKLTGWAANLGNSMARR